MGLFRGKVMNLLFLRQMKPYFKRWRALTVHDTDERGRSWWFSLPSIVHELGYLNFSARQVLRSAHQQAASTAAVSLNEARFALVLSVF